MHSSVNVVGSHIESYLKQQCLDASGLFTWERKYFHLNVIEGIIQILDNPNPDTLVQTRSSREFETVEAGVKLSVKGAKYAKEWSISTPSFGSYGFVIVWTSGTAGLMRISTLVKYSA
jgi:hypothetical protein